MQQLFKSRENTKRGLFAKITGVESERNLKAATHGPVCLSGRPAQAGLCKSTGPCGCTTRPVCLSGRPVQASLTPHSGRDRDS